MYSVFVARSASTSYPVSIVAMCYR
jgi:hypothetical protein